MHLALLLCLSCAAAAFVATDHEGFCETLVNNDFRGSVAQVLVVGISVPATTDDMLVGTKDGVSSSKCR